jgi:hypothetical protein
MLLKKNHQLTVSITLTKKNKEKSKNEVEQTEKKTEN